MPENGNASDGVCDEILTLCLPGEDAQTPFRCSGKGVGHKSLHESPDGYAWLAGGGGAASPERIEKALDLIGRYGGIDGAHHKAWVIDQVARVLTGTGYAQFVTEVTAGDDGPDTREWDEGIAP